MQSAATHAGSIVFRNDAGSLRYLIISSSNGLHWVLPKGHIEAGESDKAAALRELREESGVEGEILARLAVQNWQQSGSIVRVQYFLVCARRFDEADEDRRVLWEDEAAALARLSFENTRQILRQAVAKLQDMQHQGLF